MSGDSRSGRLCAGVAQVLVGEMEVERSAEAVVEESPKCLHQSGSEAEDTVQRIESLTQTCARVLREELGGKVVSKSVTARQTGGAQSVREA